MHVCTLHLSIVGGHKNAFAISNLEYRNNQSCSIKGMGNLHTVGRIFNPLTTDDALWHLTLGVCYQLVQPVLKIRFVSASKKGGIGRGW